MSIEEQQELKTIGYTEAIRYMDNAKEMLKKARKEDNHYSDSKYVRSASGIAYSGVLVALDTYLSLKGVARPRGKRKSIEYYTASLSKLDKKLLKHLNSVYNILHLSGYYDGEQDAIVIKRGFDNAYQVIEEIKPAMLS